ncbi:hypothetical protein HOG98_05435 [bacterium]|jgi:hypothetical protein|nr:hypothetical protein [bacterium]
MTIILFKFEKEIINFLECKINNCDFTIAKKEKISLSACKTRGQKYDQILTSLNQIKKDISSTHFAYQSPQKYRGAIKDEESFANTSILHLFCEQNNVDLLELTPPSVRDKLSIPNKDFKLLLEKEKKDIVDKHPITKSDKLIDGLTLLSLLKCHD